MKRKIFKNKKIISSLLLFSLLLKVPLTFAITDFMVVSWVYYSNNGAKQTGDVTTPNAFASHVSYRSNINGEQTGYVRDNYNAPTTSPDQAAFFAYDVQADWNTPISFTSPNIDKVVTVFETRKGLNGWTDDQSWVAGDAKDLTQADDLNTEVDHRDFVMEKIPTPVKSTSDENSITVIWKGLWDNNLGASGGVAHNSISGYSIYRSVDGGPYQTHGSPYHVSSQSAGSDINFTDTSVSVGHTYKYKLTVNFVWSAHNPNYFETVAEGPESAAISVTNNGPYVLSYVFGNNQTVVAGQTLQNPLVVSLIDNSGNPATTKTVSFSASGGTVATQNASVGSDAKSSTSWTAPTTTGDYTVTASVSGVSNTVVFNLHVVAAMPARLSITSSPQSIRAKTVSQPFTVCLQDQYGNAASSTNEITTSFGSTSSTAQFSYLATGPFDKTTFPFVPGASCATFYYKDSTIGTATITLSSDGLTGDSQPVEVIRNNIAKIIIIPDEFTINYEQTKKLIAKVYDELNDEVTDVNVVWSMTDPEAGAINQAGVYYPSKTVGTYSKMIKASVGELEAFATPTVVAAPVKEENPVPIQTPVENKVTEIINNSATNYYTIIVNNYYFGGDSTTSVINVKRANFPVILTPRNSSIVYDRGVIVSGTAGGNQTILIKESGKVIASTKSAEDGDWAVSISKNKFKKQEATIVAAVFNKDVNSIPVSFSLKSFNYLDAIISAFK